MNPAQRVFHLMRGYKEYLQGHGQWLHFKKNQVLYYQEHRLSGIYWIQEGQIILIRVENEQKHTEHKDREDILGIEEFLSGEVSGFTAQALNDCRILFVPKTIFQEWIDHHNKELQA